MDHLLWYQPNLKKRLELLSRDLACFFFILTHGMQKWLSDKTGSPRLGVSLTGCLDNWMSSLS